MSSQLSVKFNPQVVERFYPFNQNEAVDVITLRSLKRFGTANNMGQIATHTTKVLWQAAGSPEYHSFLMPFLAETETLNFSAEGYAQLVDNLERDKPAIHYLGDTGLNFLRLSAENLYLPHA